MYHPPAFPAGLAAAGAVTPYFFSSVDARAQAASKNDRPLMGCVGDDEANAWQSRPPRKGYEIEG